MKPADICIAVTVAVIRGLAFVTSRIALDELRPELMTMLRFAIAAVPLFVLSLVTLGPQAVWQALSPMSATTIGCMLFIGGVSAELAYWLWGRLLRDYPAAQVVPFALLVPFVGSAASSIAFGERFGPLRLAGMVTVIGGIAVTLLSKRPQPRAKIA